MLFSAVFLFFLAVHSSSVVSLFFEATLIKFGNVDPKLDSIALLECAMKNNIGSYYEKENTLNLETCKTEHQGKTGLRVKLWDVQCSDTGKVDESTPAISSVLPDGTNYSPPLVVCDGHKIRIQNNVLCSFVDWEQNWRNYKYGFPPTPSAYRSRYWIGLEKISQITRQRPHKLFVRVKELLERYESGSYAFREKFAQYESFIVGPESTDYAMTVSGYSGNAGDALSYSNGMKFSTPERDNDKSDTNCAKILRSGFWFNDCHEGNVNGACGGMNEDPKIGLNCVPNKTERSNGCMQWKPLSWEKTLYQSEMFLVPKD